MPKFRVIQVKQITGESAGEWAIEVTVPGSAPHIAGRVYFNREDAQAEADFLSAREIEKATD